MNDNATRRREQLDVLIGKRFHSPLSDDELKELSSFLAESPEALDYYFDMVDLHCDLMGLREGERGERSWERHPSGVSRDGKAGAAVGSGALRLARSRGRTADTRFAAGRRRATAWRWLAVAACLAIVVGSLAYDHWKSTRFADVLVARIKETVPGVEVVHRGDTVFAVIDMPLYAGDRIVTKRGGSAAFGYQGEATEIRIDENTLLDIGDVEEGKRLRLEKGVIDASVDPQPADRHMIVTTPHAKAEVKGTAFRLHVGSVSLLVPLPSGEDVPSDTPLPTGERMGEGAILGTRIDVFEGLVGFIRIADGESVDVPGGHYAVKAEGVGFAARPVSPASPIISLSPETPGALPPASGGIRPRFRYRLYGDVLFEDDFDRGLQDWDVVARGEDGTWQTAAPEIARAVTVRENVRVPDMEIIPFCVVIDGGQAPGRVVGIRSKNAIPAGRFVVEVRSGSIGPPMGGGVLCDGIDMAGIRAGTIRYGKKNALVWSSGSSWRLFEFVPMSGADEGDLVSCRVFGGGVEGRKSLAEPAVGAPWLASWDGRAASKRILIGVRDEVRCIDRVMVREIRGEDDAESTP